MSINSLVLHLFLVPQNRKLYNTHLTSIAFLVCAVNYGSPFFPLIYDQRKKNVVCNLQCKPQTPLIRGHIRHIIF